MLPWLLHARGMQMVSLIAGLTWLDGARVARFPHRALRLRPGRIFIDGYLFAAASVLGGLGGDAASVWACAWGGTMILPDLHEKVGLLIVCVQRSMP